MPTDEDIRRVLLLHQRRSVAVQGVLDATRAEARKAIAEADALLAEFGHLLTEEVDTNRVAPVRPAPQPVAIPSWDELVAEAAVEGPQGVSYRDLLTADERREVADALATFSQAERARRRLDGWDLMAAGVFGCLTGVLDLIVGGDVSKKLVQQVATRLGMPTTHTDEAPKVSFDATMPASHGARGNHRWNSVSHHVGMGGLIAAILDVFAGTSTHVVNGRVVIIENLTQGATDTLREAGVTDPGLFLIQRVIAAVGIVLRHWWSDGNTTNGLPAPWMLLAKFLEVGRIPDGEGGHMTVAELAQHLYENGLDLRRFIGDGLTALVNEVLVRLWCFVRRLTEGRGLRNALRAASGSDPRTRLMLTATHLMTCGFNAGAVYVSANPLVINMSQWTAALVYLGRTTRWAALEAAIEEDTEHRRRWTDLLRDELGALEEMEARLTGVKPLRLAPVPA
jgi:hypothetical protein